MGAYQNVTLARPMGKVGNWQSVHNTHPRDLPVIVQHGVESVRYGQYCTILELCADRVLDERICLQIDCCRRFIQNQNLGLT